MLPKTKLLSILLFLFVAACGGGSSDDKADPAQIKIAELQIVESQLTLSPGQSASLTTTATWSDGTTGPLPDHAIWRSENTSIADFGPSNVIIAIGLGSTRIWIDDNAGHSDFVTVNVISPPAVSLQRLEMSNTPPNNATLRENETAALHVEAIYSDGHRDDITALVKWEISDRSVIAIRNNRILEALAPGTATLSGSYENLALPVRTLTVVRPKPCEDCTALKLQTPLPSSLKVGQRFSISVLAQLRNGGTRDVNDLVTLRIEPSTVGSISNGEFHAQQVGQGTLIAELGNELKLQQDFAVLAVEETIAEARPDSVKLQNVRSSKVRYAPGDTVTLQLNIHSTNTQKVKISADVTTYQWDQTSSAIPAHPIVLNPGANLVELNWLAPSTDFTGYLARAQITANQQPAGEEFIAIDVSSSWTRYPRYGYLSNFGSMTTAKQAEIMEWLAEHNINSIQYYDWQYKHHQPMAGTVSNPDAQWPDIANRPTYRDTLKGLIEQGHQREIAAMHYNLLFGTYPNAQADGVKTEWGMFKDNKHQQQDGHRGLPASWATQEVLLVDPENTGWQNYIFNKTREAFQVFAFDGWHVDQLGNRGTLYSYDGRFIDLRETFTPFLTAAGASLKTQLVFNAVSNFGGPQVASQAPVESLYVEVWPDSSYGGSNKAEKYSDLTQIIEHGWISSHYQKNTTIAGYMNYNAAKNGATRFNTPSVVMTNAVILASGGWHIELGDDKQMLSSEYFPSTRLKMDATLSSAVKNYNRFATAHQHLLRGQQIRLHYPRVSSSAVQFNAYGDAGKIWPLGRVLNNQEVLHLLNLTGHTTTLWRDDTQANPTPPRLQNTPITYCSDRRILSATLASPDFNNGRPQPLTLTQREHMQQHCVDFTLPELFYWDMLVFNVEPANTQAPLSKLNKLTLAANFNGWNPNADNMQRVADYQWEGIAMADNNVGPLKFKFVGDGEWSKSWGNAGLSAFSGLSVDGKAALGGQNLELNQPLSAKLYFAFNEQTQTFKIRDAKTFYWVGHTNHFPADGKLSNNGNLWINTDTWPIGSAKSVTLLYSTNNGGSWQAKPMEFAEARTDPKNQNDWWHVNLGKPQAGTTYWYAIRAQGHDGRWLWDTEQDARKYTITIQ